jgi:hypothetical protein
VSKLVEEVVQKRKDADSNMGDDVIQWEDFLRKKYIISGKSRVFPRKSA